jgi:hypothetical protein
MSKAEKKGDAEADWPMLQGRVPPALHQRFLSYHSKLVTKAIDARQPPPRKQDLLAEAVGEYLDRKRER